jgi:hypothetical protein
MGRGPGKIEQAIIDATTKEEGALIPLWEIARDAGYDINAHATQHSWRRAAANLEAQGQVQMEWLWPFSPDREIVAVRNSVPCVGYAVGGGSDEIRTAAKLRAGEMFSDHQPLYASQKPLPRPKAQFVLDMIETGRWTVADRRTGKPVDHHSAWLESHNRVSRQRYTHTELAPQRLARSRVCAV